MLRTGAWFRGARFEVGDAPVHLRLHPRDWLPVRCAARPTGFIPRRPSSWIGGGVDLARRSWGDLMRSRHRNAFGATAHEIRDAVSGDDLVPSPQLTTTHAITIEATPERIWPWLVQFGHGRSGFYSDSRWWDACVDLYYRLLSLERGAPAERYRPADTEVVAAWQDLKRGDRIEDGPAGTAFYRVVHIERPRCLVLTTDTHLPHLVPAFLRPHVSGGISDALELRPLEGARTRVVRRMRCRCEPWSFAALALPVVYVWGEWITARQFLRGLARRAERSA